nr:geranyl transferase [Legionellales bacterium]
TLPALDIPALAVELIHCYSLIHDDLPAMDDDSLRRGQPACHIAFDEASAILAGDALQALAFDLLAQPSPYHAAVQQRDMIATLAKASGVSGMVAGQMLDLQAEQADINLAELTQIHRLKTGKLLAASIQLGYFASSCNNQTIFHQLTQVGENIGLAFQIQDDILDVTQSTQTLGKPQGADQTANKTTYLSFMSLEQAQQKVHHLLTQAYQSLQQLPCPTDELQHFIDHLAHRDR